MFASKFAAHTIHYCCLRNFFVSHISLFAISGTLGSGTYLHHLASLGQVAALCLEASQWEGRRLVSAQLLGYWLVGDSGAGQDQGNTGRRQYCLDIYQERERLGGGDQCSNNLSNFLVRLKPFPRKSGGDDQNPQMLRNFSSYEMRVNKKVPWRCLWKCWRRELMSP